MSEKPIPDASRGHILIVDDLQPNRELLRDMLESRGHTVEEAADGLTACQTATACLPEVILLDCMMPGMDGFEVCARLRAQSTTASIPILMVSALTDRESRLKGIRAGANDFLNKPIDEPELQLRIANSLVSKRLHDRLQSSYQKLSQLESMRDGLTHMLVHDLKSPLFAILGHLELLKMSADRLDEEERTSLDSAYRATGSLGELIRSILDVNQLEHGQMALTLANCDARELLTTAAQTHVAPTARVETFLELPADPVPARCDVSVMQRVIGNLVGNALKYTPAGGQVRLSARLEGRRPRLSVADSGAGIPSDLHDKIFEKFFAVESRKKGAVYSTGLGLTFCKLAVEAHLGRIGVESEPGKGSTFWIELPPAPA